ncbi:MAG: hypothetical protein ACRC35_04285 [Angustibacter sp.]
MQIPDGDGGVVSADYTALETARDRFNDLSAQFANSSGPVFTRQQTLVTACGEVGDQVEPGAIAFGLSWQAAFDVASQSAGLIAGNIGRFAVDLSAVDTDSTVTVEL